MLRRALSLLFVAAVLAAADDSFLPESSAFRSLTARVPMRDGKTLAADVYVPKRAGKSPAVLIQTPYDRKLMRRHWTGGIDDGPDALFADAHYAFVVTDWRGRNESKDAATSQPANLAQDGYD